jgi:hypothetical protein
MQDLTPVVADDEKAVQNTKRERWDGEKVHRRNGLAMVSEERQPWLDGICISRGSPDPSRDTPFRDITGTIRIQLCAKSFILLMYDVLARHSTVCFAGCSR